MPGVSDWRRRWFARSLYALLITAGGAVVHGYFYMRLVLDPDWPASVDELGLLVAAAGVGILAFHPILQWSKPSKWIRRGLFVSLVWMGVTFHLLLALATLDGVRMLASGLAASVFDPRTGAILACGAAALMTHRGLANANKPPRHRQVNLEIERWPQALDGFRIAHISDLHLGPVLGRHFAAAVAEHAMAISADLIAVTGDLVDGSVEDLADSAAPLADLHAPHGVYFVTGNHEFYADAEGWCAHLQGWGWNVLRNRRTRIGSGVASFDLAGVDDPSGRFFGAGEDLARTLDGRDDVPVVLLAHDPTTFRRASAIPVDLQLSGHTHGGQIWPVGGILKLLGMTVAGLHSRNGAALYVNQGTGHWGPPMRLATHSEITEIVLRAPKGHHARQSPGGAKPKMRSNPASR